MRAPRRWRQCKPPRIPTRASLPARAYSYTVVAVDAAPAPNVSAVSAAVSATTQSLRRRRPTRRHPRSLGRHCRSPIDDLDSRELDCLDGRQRNFRLPRLPRWRRHRRSPRCRPPRTPTPGSRPARAYSYTVAAVDTAPTPNVSAASAAASATTQALPAAGVRLAAQRVFAGLTLFAAHSLLRVPHDTTRWVVVQQDGHVLSFADTPAVATTSNVLDISDRVVFRNVHGLLGLAFHPNYPDRPARLRGLHARAQHRRHRVAHFRVHDCRQRRHARIRPPSRSCSRWRSPAVTTTAVTCCSARMASSISASATAATTTAPPASPATASSPTTCSARSCASTSAAPRVRAATAFRPTIRSRRIRCATWTAPAAPDCPEIFAWGFRNPWRWSFDSQGGQLWLGDVGSHTREEVDRRASAATTAGAAWKERCRPR